MKKLSKILLCLFLCLAFMLPFVSADPGAGEGLSYRWQFLSGSTVTSVTVTLHMA